MSETVISHTDGSIPLRKKSTRRTGRYLGNTQQAQQMNIRALCRIRTHNPKNQTTEKLRHKKHGHRQRSDKTDTAK